MNMDKKNLDFSEFDSVSKAEWIEKVIKDLKGKDFKDITWTDRNENTYQPFYTKEDLDKADTTYTIKQNKNFHVRSEFGGDDLVLINELIIEGLMSGLNSFGLTTDMTSMEIMETLLKDVDLSAVAFNILNPVYVVDICHLLIEYCEKKGFDTKSLEGGFRYAPLSSFLFHDAEPYEWKERIIQLGHIAKNRFDGFKVIDVDVNQVYNYGGDSKAELSIAICMAHEYLLVLLEEGFSVSEVAKMMRFTLAVGTSYFNEIAKFRALRSLWQQVLEQYAEEGEEIPETFIHAETSYWDLSTMDIHNNLLRATTGASSAMLGGVDSLRVFPYNMPMDEDKTDEIRLGYNIQSILIEEAYLTKVTDPGKGSYYIEELTNKLANSAWELFQVYESKGGFIETLYNEYFYMIITHARKGQELEFQFDKRIVVGVNKYVNADEKHKFNRSKSIIGDGLAILRLTEDKEMEEMKKNVIL